jgi:hypothetical protein
MMIKGFRRARAATVLSLWLALAVTTARGDDSTETIVFVRHGEKPDNGLGQLNCQGLNRALALPEVIAKNFGKPDAIFAPNPSVQKIDDGEAYDYVRPLATIEPAAIAFGLPVNTQFGLSDLKGLQDTLENARYRNTLILVAWEHRYIVSIARALLAAHAADPALVPEWNGQDFDSIYVIAIVRTGDTTKATFAHKQEGLDGQPATCPRGDR